MSAPERARPTIAPWISTLRAVVAAVEASDVCELELRAGGLRISLLRTAAMASAAPERPADRADPDNERYTAVRTPLTGIWYDSPAPGAPPYVRPGDAVDMGSIIGMVETMKVFNEVSSDAAGIVHLVLAHRGELVLANTPVLLLDPTVKVPFPGTTL